jgi:protein involved in polysaccharide export with SLBB domain
LSKGIIFMMSSRHRAAPCNLRKARAIVLLIATLLIPIQAVAQPVAAIADGSLEAGNTVQLTVEGRPDLDLLLTLDDQGSVTIPQVGQVALAGLSVEDAGRILRQRFRVFDPGLDSVTVELANSRALSIQVQGAVVNPGVFTFEAPPTVWELTQIAGGIASDAEPALARVIREDNGTARVLALNLQAVVTGGRIPDFTFRAGDVLVVPQNEDGATSAIHGAGVQVFGAVNNPSIVHLTSPQLLLDVLMLAGSPQREAKLSKIWLVHPEEGRFESSLIDLNLFLEEGDPSGNPLVYPGDTLKIAFERESWMRRNGTLILSSMTAVATLFLAIDRIAE